MPRVSQATKESATPKSARVLDIFHRWGIHTWAVRAPWRRKKWGRGLARSVFSFGTGPGENPRVCCSWFHHRSLSKKHSNSKTKSKPVEPLLFILRRFLQQLSLRLDALYLVARELRLQITFSDKNVYRHQFKIPEPTNKTEVLFRMLHAHLENFTSDSPILAVALKAEATKPSYQQFHLFETALRDPARLSETLARLTGLLGPDRVGTPVLEETHQPDAFRIEPFAWQLKETVDEKSRCPPAPCADFARLCRLRCW